MYKKIYQKLAGKGLSQHFPTNFFAKKAVKNMSGNVIAKVHDYEMIVPIKEPHGYILYLKHAYEPAVTKYVKMFLHDKQTFVDVGACLGYYSLLASKIVGKEGRVLAFEPESNNFSYCYDNFEWNQVENIQLMQLAASDKRGTANLNISVNHIGCHSLLYSELGGHTDHARIVGTIPIDQCIDKIDMVKIDVEGWEYYVLKGMESLFVKNENSIITIMEYCPSLLKDNLQLWGNLIDFLEHYADKIAIIDEKKKKLRFTTTKKLGLLQDRTNLLWWS